MILIHFDIAQCIAIATPCSQFDATDFSAHGLGQ